jgi:hypothetical protein
VAVSVVHSGGSGFAAASVALNAAPANGNIVVVFGYNNSGTGPTSVKDSNGVSLTQRHVDIDTTAGHCNWVFDYIVSGSPTATYTAAGGTPFELGALEISGAAYPGTYNGANSTSGACSASLTNVSGDAFLLAGSNSGGTSLTLTGVASTSTLDNNGSIAAIYGIANSTSSSGVDTGGTSSCVSVANYTTPSLSVNVGPPVRFRHPGRSAGIGAMSGRFIANRHGYTSSAVLWLEAEAATITSSGAFVRSVGWFRSASIASTAVLGRAIVKGLVAASLSPAGVLVRSTIKGLAATVTSSAAFKRVTGWYRSATITSSSAYQKAVSSTKAATLNLTGALSRSISSLRSATISPAGAFLRSTAKGMAATITSSAVLQSGRHYLKALAAQITSSGAIIRSVAKTMAATVTSSAALRRAINWFRSAAINPVGATKNAISSLRSATISPTGVVTKAIRVLRTASIALSGNLVTQAVHFYLKTLAATMSSTAVLARTTSKGMSATGSFAGDLKRNVAKFIAATEAATAARKVQVASHQAASIAPSGSFARRISRALLGVLTSAGTLTEHQGATLFNVVLTATIALAGGIQKQADKVEVASLSLQAAANKSIASHQSALIAPTGAIRRGIARAWNAVVSFVGNLIPFKFHPSSVTMSLPIVSGLTFDSPIISSFLEDMPVAQSVTLVFPTGL